MVAEGDFPQGYRRFEFSTSPPPCGPSCAIGQHQWLRALDFEVTEVWGTSAVVARGERYVVKGRYTLTGDEPFAISLAVFSKAFGATAHLLPGEHLFETSTEILEFVGRPDQLGIVVGKGADTVLTTWLTLKDKPETP